MRNRSVNSISCRRQQGVVLFVALIAMLVLTLGGVAIMRMVNNSNSLAGNIAFRQAALGQSDRGVNAAFTWLVGRPNTALYDDAQGAGYQSTRNANITDWTLAGPWNVGTVTLPTLNGYTVSYRIFRLCNIAGNGASSGNPGAVNAPGQSCNTSSPGGSNVGNSQTAGGGPPFSGNLQVYYQVVVRVLGPRNTASYVQVMISRGA